jgi:hypothetical protein
LLLSFGPDDRKILAERLRLSGGRVFDYLAVPPPPRTAEERESKAQRDLAYATLLKIERDAAMRDQSRSRRADERLALTERAAAAIAATPFDAAAVKKAFADLSRHREEDATIRRNHMIDALAALPVAEREAILTAMPNLIGRIAYNNQ